MTFAIPEPLRSARAWLVWRLIQKPEQKKPSKIPFYVSGQPRGDQGSDADRAALVSFDDALAAAQRGGYTGIGFATFSDLGVVALDFDNVVVDGHVRQDVLDVVAGSYAELSPSGTGVRAFFLGSLPSRKDTKGDPSIEFFGDTGFVTVTGNVLPGSELWGVADVTPAVHALFVQRFGDPMPVASSFAGSDLMAIVPTLGWSLDEARAILMDCDAGCDRDHWVKALAALHHEMDGSPAALQLADEWSARGENYSGRADVEGRWRSFGKGRANPITGRWLLKWRDECSAHLRYRRVGDWKARIATTADEFTLREKVCVEITRDDVIGELEREALAQALFDRFKLMGTKFPIAQCRKMLEPRKVERQTDTPKWARPWVYVTDVDQFYRQDSDEWLSMQSFNAKFNRLVMGADEEVVKSASWVALEAYALKTVTRGMYVPWAGPVFEMEGVECVNTYRPSSTPRSAEVVGAGGQGAIKMLRQHISLLAGGRAEVIAQVESWMAFCAQKPGVKIRWAPLIKGVEGDGKTLVGAVLSAVMGHANVKQISPTVLGTDFTDWAHGACVGVLEEIKLTGHNRYDILNALKPFITNDKVPIHPKGGAEHNVINTMNYVAFTNHVDALPLGDTDRRWMVIYTPFGSLAELLVAIRGLGWGDTGAYFDALYAAIQTHASELRHWLLSYPVAPAFKPNGSAPMTDEKAQMVAMSASPEEEAVRDALEARGLGVSETVLSSSCMTSTLDVAVQTTAVNRVLVKLGWSKLPKKLKWRGQAHIVWIKGKVDTDTDALREALDKTCETSQVDLFGVPSGSESLFD